ncbi:Structure-specific endonuclease subunit SLX1, partial [Candida maltosa Xu316]
MSQPQDKPSLHVTPLFYGVYILQSEPKPRSFYVGSTPDPKRRLRQHNGDLKTGGAYRTKRNGSRPWKMIVLIHGFPSRVSALQFEHSLQHAHQTRHIDQESRVTTSSRQSSLHSKLANVRLLMKSFRKMGLTVTVFDENVFETWQENKLNIEFDPPCDLRQFESFCDSIRISGEEEENIKDVLLNNNLNTKFVDPGIGELCRM